MRPFKGARCGKRSGTDLHEEVFETERSEGVGEDIAGDSVRQAVAEGVRGEGVPKEDVQGEDASYDYHALHNDSSAGDSDEDYDPIHGIYTIGVAESQDKAALYGQMMHYYAEQAGTIPRPQQRRSKSVLWYMLAILVSNPIIGLYTMAHFTNWDTWVTRNVVVRDNQAMPLVEGARAPAGTVGDSVGGALVSSRLREGHLAREPPAPELVVTGGEFTVLARVANRFSQKVKWYAGYEVLGELVFALFSLALLCASGMCCTDGRHRAQSMIPIIGLLYTVIYKVLAMYVLVISLKILNFYLVAAYPEAAARLPLLLLRMLAIAGTDPTDQGHREAMSRLLALDAPAHRWVVVYCLENVYITITDSVETVHALSKILMRAGRRVLRRMRRQQELVYFSMNTMGEPQTSAGPGAAHSCSYMLLDSLLSRPTEPQEAYIHHMYNKDVPDVGTYLDNVDVEQYQDGIARVGPKLMSQLRSKESREFA